MLSKIRKRVKSSVKFTDHALKEMLKDNLYVDDVIEAVSSGEIIENYCDDKPFPSCLICGKAKHKNIHAVCAIPEHVEVLIVVTVYLPDPEKWINFKIRKK